MGEEALPTADCGFVYILSNDSMPGLHKIGITTNRVSQRMRELNSTGVPTPFKAERVFAVRQRYLSQVEKAVHRRLNAQGFHCGKEFFRASLQTCGEAVEDALLELAGESTPDLIGQARARAAAAEADRRQMESERALARERQKRLEEENARIRQLRSDWVESNLKEKPWGIVQVVLGVVFGLPFAALFATIAFALGGPLTVVAIVAGVWWVHKRDESVQRAQLEMAAETGFPLIADTPGQTMSARDTGDGPKSTPAETRARQGEELDAQERVESHATRSYGFAGAPQDFC